MLKKIRTFYKSAYQDWDYPTIWQAITSNKVKFVHFGYLGDYNFGDVMVYHAALKIFNEEALIFPFKLRMPLLLKFAIKTGLLKISGIVIGGGTIMGVSYQRDYFMAALGKETPVFLHGTGSTSGINDQEFWSAVLNNCKNGGVRGTDSQEVVNQELSKKVEIVGDAALGLFEDHFWSATTPDKDILINLGTHHNFPGRDEAREALKTFLEQKSSEELKIGFLPMHRVDVELGEALRKQFPQLVLYPIPRTTEEAIAVYHQYEFAVGERLHFNVLAAMAKCPFLSINYRPKHNDFLATISLLHAGIDPPEVTPVLLEEGYAQRASFNWEDALHHLQDLRDRQRQEALEFLETAGSNARLEAATKRTTSQLHH